MPEPVISVTPATPPKQSKTSTLTVVDATASLTPKFMLSTWCGGDGSKYVHTWSIALGYGGSGSALARWNGRTASRVASVRAKAARGAAAGLRPSVVRVVRPSMLPPRASPLRATA
ncbi:hypothetical protein ACFFOS_26640 [Nocardioides kongjuensis]|uniref:hypothetical protein n=1 Tax=Nocardioides kongjuensis TaxID=349522 RepID=UPI0035EB6DF3